MFLVEETKNRIAHRVIAKLNACIEKRLNLT